MAKQYKPVILTPQEIAWVVAHSTDQYERMNQTMNRSHITGTQKEVAVAIILAETDPPGNVYSLNDKPPDLSFGLAQINMIGVLGPVRRAQFGIKNNEELYQVERNIKAMAFISSNGSNWRPWSTYTNGAYRKHLNVAREAVKTPANPGSKLSSPEEKAALEASPFEQLADWVGKGVFRVGMFIGGGALVIGAVVLTTKKGLK